MPCELVQHHDPRRPLLVGGLAAGEEKQGSMRVRFKRHRWFPKLLKNRDPLVWSIGWRRFQAMPVYSIEDHNRCGAACAFKRMDACVPSQCCGPAALLVLCTVRRRCYCLWAAIQRASVLL